MHASCFIRILFILGGILPALCALSTTECSSNKKSSPTSKVPGLHPSFTSVIGNSEKLQFPQSAVQCLSKADLGSKYLDSRFYIETGGEDRLIFKFPNAGSAKDRMELRGKTFSSSGSNTVKWEGRFRLPKRSDAGYSPRFTVGQLFSESRSDDVAGIRFYASYKGKANNLWLIYNNSYLNCNDKVDPSCKDQAEPLGTAPSGGTHVYIRMDYNRGTKKLSVYRGSKLVKGNLDVSRKVGSNVYFKAGCYLQDAGKCQVEFELLKYA